jgi:endonuclease/exonuclease/phosphatase family metal-dependent hydrolase
MSKRRTITNFDDPQGPVFAGSFAPEPPPFDGGVLVVSFNLQYGQNVETAVEEFRTHDPLPEADVIFLQEMDEDGVGNMAEALGFNFVYLPASIHTFHDKPFGNAVLSRWPVSDYHKLILPRLHPISRQMRIAAGAKLDIGGREVLAYSVHTEIYTTTPQHRKDQATTIAEAGRAAPYVIVGGDFNTVHSRNISDLDKRFGAAGMVRISKDAGHTVEKFGRDIHADHLFARGFRVAACGTVSQVRSSDHLPVWVDLAFDEPGASA